MVLAVAGSAHASSEAWGFGVTPWFHLGHSWGSWPNEAAMPARRGLGVELNLNAVAVTPSDWLAFGVSSGLLTLGARPVMGDRNGSSDGLDFVGLQVLPFVMVQLIDVLSLHAKAGYVLVNLTVPGGTEVGAGAVRFGGGLTMIVFQNSAANLAVQVDVLHTLQVAVADGGPMGTFRATTVSLGVGVGFNPNLD